MTAHLNNTASDPQRTIAELQRKLDERTSELDEALAQQIATADVLQVINSSRADLAPVFDVILERAMRLCEAQVGVLWTYDGEYMRASASRGAPPAYAEFLKRGPHHPSRVQLRLLGGSEGFVQVADLTVTEGYRLGDPMPRAAVDLGGIRTILVVPLRKHETQVGQFAIYRQDVRPFADKQIVLLQSFATPAVIAIENARLFDEVQTKNRDLSEALTYQTGSSNILSVIASSPTDVGPVLKAIVESASELCEAYDALVYLKEGDDLRFSAHHGPIQIGLEKWPINRSWVTGRSVIDKVPMHVHDLLSPEGAEFPKGQEMSRAKGFRTVLSVPMLREGESIGAIVLRRIEVHPFSDKQIAMLQTFADQAVIALSNVRLFEELRERTDELTESLEDLRTAQDRLVQTQKLASLGQLTAGIAHEIKNPLNFVNNFSALSKELVDELGDALKPVALDDKKREELDELTHMLKGNLEKVVQHGKRADSIVKNMLLHSREGSGEHRPADINAILDESLNLAYHGARAEKPDFHVTLQRDFDPSAGMIDMFLQEITRAFLNLISNGFYAVTKRKTEIGSPDFEPCLSAATKNLGNKVEIRIRDNGTGIPAEVKEKIFNPFFTTKPAGEGTGLGLSMSHDIVVKQHGGTIDVETEPGRFTEFKIVLPRTSQT